MNEYCYADIYVGQEETFSVVIDQDKMDKFREITGDCNPLHTDTDFAQHGTDQKKPFTGGYKIGWCMVF